MTAQLTVFRVETPCGHGPYWTTGDDARQHIAFDEARQPGPRDDGLSNGDETRCYEYGFKDLEQLKTWFNDQERVGLSSVGYLVGVYSVPPEHVNLGRKQLQFKKSLATRIAEHLLLTSV